MKTNRVVWLEDDPDTIEYIVWRLEDMGIDVKVCQSFNRFTSELSKLNDTSDNIIIIDIRMSLNNEMTFRCSFIDDEESIEIQNRLYSGFEYFNRCIKDRFKNVNVCFFTSKPMQTAQDDASIFNIQNKIITKKNTQELINKIKKGDCL